MGATRTGRWFAPYRSPRIGRVVAENGVSCHLSFGTSVRSKKTSLFFGNGDIDSPEKALEYKETYGVDGIMIGRASIGNPWIFAQIKHFMSTGEKLPEVSINERVSAARKHLRLSLEWKGEKKGIYEMRRHYTNYFRGVAAFKPFRMKLVEAMTFTEVSDLLDEIQERYQEVLILQNDVII